MTARHTVAELEAELAEARQTITTLKGALAGAERLAAAAAALPGTVPAQVFACALLDELLSRAGLDARYLHGEGWTLEEVALPGREVAADTLGQALAALGVEPTG